jgi:hypothetical protein
MNNEPAPSRCSHVCHHADSLQNAVNRFIASNEDIRAKAIGLVFPSRMATLALAFMSSLALTLVISTRAWADEMSPELDISNAKARTWRPGQPVPDGYRVVRKRALGIVGVSLFGGGYALSALSGLALMAGCSIPAGGGSDSSTCHNSISSASATWLLLPVAGPFAALTRSDVQKDGGAVFWFSTFGAMQVVGAGLLTYYFAAPKYRLEKSDDAGVILLPVFGRHMQGLWLSERF